MGVLTLSGSISSGPANGGDGTSLPTSQDTIPLATSRSPKDWATASGTQLRILSSPSSFATLSGVGAADSVTRGTFLYARCNAGIQLRLTMEDPAAGPDVVSVLMLSGPLLIEFPDNGRLKLLEAKGVASVEWLVTGPI